MEKKPAVLLVHNHYRIRGGEDTVVENEKQLLESHGHRVVMYERNNTEIDDFGLFGKILLPFVSIYNPRTSREIKKLIKREHIDIVHVHNTLALISPAVYYAAAATGVPVVQTLHNFRLVCANALLFRNGKICEDCLEKGPGCAVKHACYRNSRLQTLVSVAGIRLHRAAGIYSRISYIFLSEFNRKKILGANRKKQYIDPEKTYIKPNLVPGAQEEAAAPAEGKKEGFVFVGRPEEIKGIRVLIGAWRLMGESAPVLSIAGTGELEEWCRSEIREHGLNIKMLGYKKHDEVMALIKRSKALVLPTLVYEGNPMSVIEALASGIPVIVSDIGNGAELIKEGRDGTHFKTGSPESLAQAVMQLDERMKAAGDEKIVMPEIFRPETNYNALAEIYRKVMTEKG